MTRGVFVFISVVVLGCIGVFVYNTLLGLGVTKELAYHAPDQCYRVTGKDMAGPEDIQIAGPYAVISADDRRATSAAVAAGDAVSTKFGGVYVMDMRLPRPDALRMSHDGPEDFHPHGLSIWKLDDRKYRLFLINHPVAGGHTVELFDWDMDQGLVLTHVETITDPHMLSPNDLVATGPRSFYFTNDRGSETDLGRTLESVMRLSRSQVGYYDGTNGRFVITDLKMANGITTSHDGTELYVAELMRGTVNFYDIDQATMDVTLTDQVALNTGLDNLDVDEDGNIWSGAHVKLLDFVTYAGDETKLAPSHIVKLTLNKDGPGGKVDEVLLSDGADISASTVAAKFGNRIAIGSVMDSHALICELD